jgi:hypothetical protein
VKFNHRGIPTAGSFDGEIPLPHLKMTVSDHQANPFGIQWQRYWDDAPYPDLVKSVPHVAFEVDDLTAVLAGQHVIIEPNSPSKGVLVAFIEVSGARAVAHTGANGTADCGVTFRQPGTWNITATLTWRACWAVGVQDGPPPAGCNPVPGAALNAVNWARNVNIHEIQAANGGG